MPTKATKPVDRPLQLSSFQTPTAAFYKDRAGIVHPRGEVKAPSGTQESNAHEVLDSAEKARALGAIVDHIAPGRSRDVRGPNAEELDSTKIISLELLEASAKVREGGPVDKREDIELPVWAGQLTVSLAALEPIADPEISPDVELPEYLRNWRWV